MSESNGKTNGNGNSLDTALYRVLDNYLQELQEGGLQCTTERQNTTLAMIGGDNTPCRLSEILLYNTRTDQRGGHFSASAGRFLYLQVKRRDGKIEEIIACPGPEHNSAMFSEVFSNPSIRSLKFESKSGEYSDMPLIYEQIRALYLGTEIPTCSINDVEAAAQPQLIQKLKLPLVRSAEAIPPQQETRVEVFEKEDGIVSIVTTERTDIPTAQQQTKDAEVLDLTEVVEDDEDDGAIPPIDTDLSQMECGDGTDGESTLEAAASSLEKTVQDAEKPLKRGIQYKSSLAQIEKCTSISTGERYSQSYMETVMMTALVTALPELTATEYDQFVVIGNNYALALGSREMLRKHEKIPDTPLERADRTDLLVRLDESLKGMEVTEEQSRRMQNSILEKGQMYKAMERFCDENKAQLIFYSTHEPDMSDIVDRVILEQGRVAVLPIHCKTVPGIFEALLKTHRKIPFCSMVTPGENTVKRQGSTVAFIGYEAREAFQKHLSEYISSEESMKQEYTTDLILFQCNSLEEWLAELRSEEKGNIKCG